MRGLVARMSEATSGDNTNTAPDIAEPVIGRAFARPVGSSGLRLLRLLDARVTSGKSPAAFAARSPHERSDMRELNKRTPDIAALIRATPAGQANNVGQITRGICCA